MHTAFQLSQLIPPASLGSDAITSILLHHDQIIIGTDKGDLLIFELSNAASTSRASPQASLSIKREGLTKKSIDQLGYLKELDALICLSGGDVYLYDLPTLSLIMSLSTQTRSAASLFLLSTLSPRASSAASDTDETGSTIRTILAVACRRKLILFSWIDGIWITPIELALPHQIRGMDTIMKDGEMKIVAGFSTGDYGIVSTSRASLSELFTPSIPSSILSASMTSNVTASTSNTPTNAGGSALERLGGLAKVSGGLAKATGTAMGLSSLGSIANLSLSTKKIEKNDVIALGHNGRIKGKEREKRNQWMFGKSRRWEEDRGEDNEVIVIRDNIALPLRFSPRSPAPVLRSPSASIKSQAIVYPIPPIETVVLAPYIISLLPSSNRSSILQINSMESLELVQNITVPSRTSSPPASISDTSSLSVSSPPTSTTLVKLLTVSSTSSNGPPLILLLSSTTPMVTETCSLAEQSIWIVEMKSWAEQVEELGRMGQWTEAIRLLRQSSDGESDLSIDLLRRLSLLHALSLFESHLYDLSIDAFISLDLSPAKIISLYPAKISGKLFSDAGTIEELFGGRSRVEVIDFTEESERKRAIQIQEESERSLNRKKSIALLAKDDDSSSIRSTRFGSRGRQASWMGRAVAVGSGGTREDGGTTAEATLESIAEATAAQAEKDAVAKLKIDQHNLSRSVDVLIRYLTDRRQKYSHALSQIPPLIRPVSTTARPLLTVEELHALPDTSFDRLSTADLIKVATVVDTALFRCYLSEGKMMLGSLCRIENWCEVEEVEEALLGAQKYAELLDLYNGKSMHEKAVKLLKQMSEDESDPEEKVGPTVRYVQKLGVAHLPLIFESSKWIFSVDQNAGLQIYVADLKEVESLPRHEVMHHLESIDSNVCAAYLEHIIIGLDETGAEFHEKLIELYLADIKPDQEKVARSNTSGSTASNSQSSYHKLLDFLESSTAYRADRILGRLPSEDLYAVRAILLGRLGRHEGALSIYVNQLKDHTTAEGYCSRVYEAIPSMRPTIFHLLLRLYLLSSASTPSSSSTSSSLTPALALLAKHATSLSPVDVLDLLPPLLPLVRIQTFLEKSLRRSGEQRREGMIMRGIAKSEMERIQGEVVEWEEKKVKIGEMRICPQCHKRLGNSVIAIHAPHGEVTHYQCREEYQQHMRR